MEAGNLNPNSKTDNTIDASDSPVFDDTEVSGFDHFFFGLGHFVSRLGIDVDGIFSANGLISINNDKSIETMANT